MSRLRHITILMLALLFVLAVCTGVHASDDDQEMGTIALITALPEIDVWGAQEGIQHLSPIGNWADPEGIFIRIEVINGKYRLRKDFAQGFYKDIWIAVRGDEISLEGNMVRRSTEAPTVPFEGDFLACIMQKHDDSSEDLAMIFSKKGSDLVYTAFAKGDKRLATMTIQRKDDSLVVINKNGDVIYSLKAVQPNEQPAPDTWKVLREESMFNLRCLAWNTQDYVDKHNGNCPPMKSCQQLDTLLEFGWKNQPGTGLPYKYNPALSGKKASSIMKSSGVVLYYDAKPWPDGTRCVAFTSTLDPACYSTSWRIVSAAEWEKLAKANHLK